jgi:uncharacterized protein YutE (UPF0331/DUF86 family)
MTADVLLRKAARLIERLSKIEPLAGVELPRFQADEVPRDACAFYLVLAVEECSDLAEHLIAEKGWGAPESAGEEFDLLARQGVISAQLARRMREAVGMRNLLVHRYVDADWSRVYEAARDLSRLREFLAAVLGYCKLPAP